MELKGVTHHLLPDPAEKSGLRTKTTFPLTWPDEGEEC